MIPTADLTLAMLDLLAADATTLAPPTDANKVVLVVQPFVPSPLTVIGDLTLATFTGSSPKLAGTGTQTVGYDPITGRFFIQIKEPVGGWSWLCTVAPASTETVYGFALVDNAQTTYLAGELAETPVPITNVNDTVSVGYLRLWLAAAALS